MFFVHGLKEMHIFLANMSQRVFHYEEGLKEMQTKATQIMISRFRCANLLAVTASNRGG